MFEKHQKYATLDNHEIGNLSDKTASLGKWWGSISVTSISSQCVCTKYNLELVRKRCFVCLTSTRWHHTIDHSANTWVLLAYVCSHYRNLIELYICDLCTFLYMSHMSKSTLKIMYSVNSIIISGAQTFKHSHFLCSRISFYFNFFNP